MILYIFKSNSDFSHILDILINKRLFLPNYKILNDPMEGSFSFSLRPEDKSKFTRFEKLLESVRVGSLANNCNHGLLWSHYTNGYRGCAVGLEVNDSTPNIHDVEYVDSLPDIGNNWNLGDPKVQYIFTKKLRGWDYEGEKRIIAFGSKAKKHFNSF